MASGSQGMAFHTGMPTVIPILLLSYVAHAGTRGGAL